MLHKTAHSLMKGTWVQIMLVSQNIPAIYQGRQLYSIFSIRLQGCDFSFRESRCCFILCLANKNRVDFQVFVCLFQVCWGFFKIYFILFLRQRTLIDDRLHCSVQESVGNMVELNWSKLFYQKKKIVARVDSRVLQDLVYSDRQTFLLGLGGNKLLVDVNQKFLWQQYYFDENACLKRFRFPRYRLELAQSWESKSLVSHTKV